jgi:dTMP kinase
VCDRFTDASRAYQGVGRGLGLERINLMAEWVQGDLQPDLTLLLDAPAAIAMARTEKRGAADRLDSEDAGFYQRVRDGYLDLAAAEPERFRVVDASQELEQVQAAIAVEIHRLLSNSSD